MQSVVHNTTSESVKESGNSIGKSSSPNSSPNGQNLARLQETFMTDLSDEDEEVSEVDSFIIEHGDLDEEPVLDTSKFLLASEGAESPDLRSVDPETQARLEALLEAAGIGKLSTADGKHFADPEVLRKLTSSVSCALDEAAAALTRMRAENPDHLGQGDGSLAEACTDGDVGTVKKLLDEGRSVHETTEEGESLLSLACSAGYFELAQVLLAMRANVEDRGIKGDCTPLMEAASAGHADIVRLLIAHGADVNAQSSSGNTPLMYACAGGHEEVVKVLLEAGSNVEDHNENGHTPLMEAASAGHVNVARILLQHGAGINTHSNEFKESALTLACYKGHLEMVRFLLEAGADQEHKTDEMHTALMEASMDGHVDVARLLLDSGAQVNMPADSFESPLTLAACGGHVELAMLLLERGANIEEVNDEGYTPLMEAAREGHEEMVALLLSQGADINAQTEETQETALTLACCGGFSEVADFLIKAGADIELGASTPLMEAAQEGHLELVRFLLDASANVHAQTQTGDTALTYACENGHTDVADLLLQAGADLEHESEGGRTPLMKAARAGHLCTVQFLISRGADVNRQTTNNDHTPLSLACAGGHLAVVELLLAHGADPTHQLKDNSTMLIEAAKGGHIEVVQLLLDYPHNMMTSPPPPDLSQLTPPNVEGSEAPRVPPHGLQVVVSQDSEQTPANHGYMTNLQSVSRLSDTLLNIRDTLSPNTQPNSVKQNTQKSFLRNKNNNPRPVGDQLTTAELQQIKNTPQLPTATNLPPDLNYEAVEESFSGLDADERDLKKSERFEACITNMMKAAELRHPNREEQIIQKQQILEELQRVERELQEKAQAQLLLNAAAVQHQQRLEQHHQHLTSQGLLSPLSAVSPATTNQNVAACSGILDMAQVAALNDFNGVLNLELAEPETGSHMLPSVSDVSMEKPMVQLDKKESKNNKQYMSSSNSLLELDEVGMIAAGIPMMTLDQVAPPPPPRQLMNPEALQTLSLKAIAQSEQAGVLVETLHTAQMAGAKMIPEMLPVVDPTTMTHGAPTAFSISVASSVVGSQDNSLLARSVGAQGNKNQLNSIDAQNFVGSLPGDSPLMVTLGGVGSPVYPVSLALPPNMPVALPPGGPTTIPQLVDDGLMVAAPARTLHETFTDMSENMFAKSTEEDMFAVLAEGLFDSIDSTPQFTATKQTTVVNHQVAAQQYITTNTNAVATQYVDQSLVSQQATPNLPFLSSTVTTTTSVTAGISATPSAQIPLQPMPTFPALNVNSQTDSNRDTALTLACAGGHDDLVQLLLNRGANLEHRDKKGFTPLILAATAGHARVVEILLNHGADIEAQSERTKDTPLSLACSGGRYEVVELLLARGANKEHRNVSDYTPLSLAASGGYVNIIKLLLNYGAEINSRTNSKLGISPLMLAAMNGHTAAVKLLLDNGGDINAQIETNRNTALTLACFQGRHEVVSLLVDRKANVEHRAKTGLTPLMEAASGGYVEVGRVLLDKGADVNAPPVPSSRDTALTIAADKGHYRFVELLLSRGAQVDVKNKKGNSPLWLAANGGHLDVVQLLVSAGADIDSQDNRKVSCLMAAFRKGHLKVVKWMVRHVSQFPSDQEMTRFIATITDKELLKKCHQCMENIRVAKDRQAVEANKYATILLEELDMEKTREESKKAAAARRRERKRKKKKEKQEKKMLQEENKKNECKSSQSILGQMQDENHTGGPESIASSTEDEPLLNIEPPSATTMTTIGTAITTTSKPSKQNNNLNLKNKISSVKLPLHPPPSIPNIPLNSNNNNRVKSMGEKTSEVKADSLSGGNELIHSKSMVLGTPTPASDDAPVALMRVTSEVTPNSGSREREHDRDKAAKKERRENLVAIRSSLHRESKTSSREKDRNGDIVGKNRLGGGGGGGGGNSSTMVVLSSTASTNTTLTTTTVTSWCNNKTTTVSSTSGSGSNKRKKGQYTATGAGDLDEFSPQSSGGSNAKVQKGSGNNSTKKEVSVTTAIENFMSLSVDGYDLPTLACLRSPTALVNSLKSPPASVASPKRGSKREEGWKEVVRRSKKVLVPANAISRVIGRGGCNINAIREVSGAHIEVEKQKGAGDRTVIIKGSADSTRQAHQLISALIKDPDRDLVELLPRTLSSKSSSVQSKSVSSGSSSSTSQALSVASNNSQLKVTLVTSSSSSTASSSASSLSSVTSSRLSGKSSVASNSAIGIYSTPPFPLAQPSGVGLRQSLPNTSNSRPGIPMSPLGSAFANSNIPAWSVPTAVTSNSVTGLLSPKRVSLVRSTSATTSANNQVCSSATLISGSSAKSPAARQLFPSEKRSGATTQSTTTSTKTTVSYTTATSFQGKNTFTVSANGASFASKVTKCKVGAVSAQARTCGSNGNAKTSTSVGGSGMRPAQSTPNISQTSTAVSSAPPAGSPPQALLNGPLPQPIGSQPRSQPSTPTSSGPMLLQGHNVGINTNNPTSSTMLGQMKVSSPQEYSPFNSFFSQVAQQSVWGKEKDGDNRGMNFASVAAANMKPLGSNTSMTPVPVPVPNSESQQVDAAKAPGYRGSSHISPGSSSSTSAPIPIGNATHGPMSNSAPSTPPLGPIAPPMSISHASRRSPSPLLRSPTIGPGSLQRSPIESPILSSSAPVGSNVPMNAAPLALSNLVPGAPPNMSSPGSGQPHSSQLTLMTSQATGLTRPLQLNPSTSSFPSAASPHAPSPRFSGPAPNMMSSQSGMMGMGSNNPPPQTIQSNLNPNAPDFSSRTNSNMVGGSQPSMSFMMNRLTPFGDASAPPLSAFRPMLTAPPNSFVPGQGLGRHPFLLPPQHQSPQQQQPQPPQQPAPPPPPPQQQQSQQPQVSSNVELSHPNIGIGSGPNLTAESVRLMSNAANVFGHRQQQQPIGTAPVMPMGPQALAVSLNNQHFSSLQGQMLVGHRSASTTPSMGTSSKDEGSPITTISPVNSPQSSNPASPTGVGLTSGPPNEQQHPIKAIGEDRKFLRPIGTERAHRKTPVFSGVSDIGGIWSFPSSELRVPDINPDWIPGVNPDVPPEAPAEPPDDSVPILTSSYVARFGGDSMGPMDTNNHHLDPQFQSSMMPPPPVTNIGVNSPYPRFVNGMPPQMLSQLYGGNGNNGLMNDVWPNTVKLGAGDSVMAGPPGSQGSGPSQHLIQEPKMMWNWSQLQM